MNIKINQIKIFVMYAIFGMAVIFAVAILMQWIFQEMAQPIPMSLLMGALVGVAFKLFSDAVAKEQAKMKEVEKESKIETGNNSDLAPPE
ncbi:MAG TPA: hypothetical protein ENN67_04240 [Firmicutes bacterium]|nr:hypothetical protein [Bacillota bacterium]